MYIYLSPRGGGSIDPDQVRVIVKEELEPVEDRVEVLEEKVEDLEEDVKDIDKRIDEVEEVTSIALNDLNTRVNEKTTEQWVKDQEYLTEPDLKTINGKSIVGTGNIDIQSQSFILEIEEKMVSTDVYVYEMTDAVEQADNLNKYFVKNGETAPVIVKFTDKSGNVTVFDVDKRDVDIASKLLCHFYTEKLYIEISGNGDVDAETGHLSKVTSVDVDIKDQSKHLVEEDLKTVNGESLVGTGDIEIEVGDAMFTLVLTKDTETGVYSVEDDDLVALDKFFTEHRDKSNILFLEKKKVSTPGLIPPYVIQETGYLDKAFARIAPTGEVWTLNRSYRFYTNRFEVAFRVSGKKDETSVVLDKTIVDRTLATEKWVEDQEYITEPDLKTLNGESLVGTGNIEIVIPLAKDDYDALPEAKKKEENVAYFVQDDDDAVEVLFTDKLIEGMKDKLSIIMLDSLYPVGSYSFGVKPNIGTWEEVVGDRALWLKNTADDGTEIAQALPNITGTLPVNYVSSDGYPALGGAVGSATVKDGALQVDSVNDGVANRRWPAGCASTGDGRRYPTLRLNASQSNSVYKDGANVQPNAYVIKVFKRIA